MMLFFTLFIVLILLMAYFSGIEIAFISSNKLSIEIKKKQDNIRANLVSKLYKKPGHFITTTLIGLNACYVLLGLIFQRYFESFEFTQKIPKFGLIVIETLITTIIVLIFVDYIPKALFKSKSETILLLFARVSFYFHKLFLPLVLFFDWMSKKVLRTFFKVESQKEAMPFSMVDLEEFVKKYSKENQEEDVQFNNQIFNNILELPSIKVKYAMVPRNEIICLESKKSVSVLKKLFISSKHSRIIIYDGVIDNIVGYCHHLDLIKKTPKRIIDIIHSLPTIPENMTSDIALGLLIKQKKGIAWVVDEFGGTAGILTMEDLVEEIFGEIEDEFDEEEIILEKQIDNKTYIFSGRIELFTLKEKYGIIFPESEVQTLSGYLISHNNTIPVKNEEIIIGDYAFTALNVSEKKIERIKVRKIN